MKTTTTAIAAYVSPKIRVVEIDIQGIICESRDYSATGQNGIWEDPE